MIQDFILRPVQEDDFESLLALTRTAEPGMTSLSSDRDALGKMFQNALHSFSMQVMEPGPEFYWFVLEELESKSIVGCCGVWARIGTSMPFYSYHVLPIVRESKHLNKRKKLELLQLEELRNGPSEVGALYLHPDYRKCGVGRLLSLGRFLFVAAHPHRFDGTIIAEMRGRISASGESAFWHSLGEKFFDMPFTEADHLSSKNKQFIAELMPKYPIYTVLLSDEARACMYQTHDNTRPALRLLEREGFTISEYIDIFDGGAKLSVEVNGIRTVSDSQIKMAKLADSRSRLNAGFIVSNDEITDFRACLTDLDNRENAIYLPERTLKLMGCESDESLRYVTARP